MKEIRKQSRNWHERFRDLLKNRHLNLLEHAFNAIKKAGKTIILSVEDVLNLADSSDTKSDRASRAVSVVPVEGLLAHVHWRRVARTGYSDKK